MRVVKVSDGGGRRRRGALSLDDCRCPVCLEIFMEPVTLPCTHTFCKACFLESVDKATLCCPLCRKRVSTWARLNGRNQTLVDQQLWDQIQTCFPLQCQRRLTGQDTAEDEPGVSVCFPRVSQPGELKQEYEDQVSKLTEEKRVMDEEERRASENYIHTLLAEEEALQQEEMRRREDDERLARLLSSQLNSAPISQENAGPATATPAKKNKKVSVGQMEKFLYPIPSNSSFMANKENILLSREKLQMERPPPQQTGGSDPPSATVEVQTHPLTPGSHKTGDGSAKRKISELETSEEEEDMLTKRGCHSIPSSSLEVGGPALLGIAEMEVELLSRRQQEEEDRQLALLLQKELDQQEKQRSVDRRSGSSDPYLLRQHSRRESVSSNTPIRPPRKTPKFSTSSTAKTKETPSSSSSAKTSSSTSSSRKQATLTEMFPGLSG